MTSLLSLSYVFLITLTTIPYTATALQMSSFLNKSVEYRPSIHFTPEVGFMNDPNGLIYDNIAKRYHMYYQLNPNDTIAGNQHWGHATSSDLLHWTDHEIAISPSADGGSAFSGSVVNDVQNTSGLFTENKGQNFVAILTRAYPDKQEQVLQYSTDGGMTYQDYEHNPILNLNLSQFRDPQVQWIEKYKKWVMVVALSREHKIQFYESKNLKNWTKLSEFQSGILGVDYECPSLIPVLDEDNEIRWVLFISINPGAPLGGSGTQYFIGDFDGTNFVLDKQQNTTQLVDFAKDNYALQYINPGIVSYNETEDAAIAANSTYIGWFGNWQYCQETPSNSWRSAMTLARTLSLRKNWLGVTSLVQEPSGVESIRIGSPLRTAFNVSKFETSPTLDLSFQNTTAVEIIVEGAFAPFDATSPPGSQRLYLNLFNSKNESLQIGVDALRSSVWIDRGKTRGFDNPFFTDKFSAAIEPTTSFKWRIILDASLLEFYAEEGLAVASVLYFADSPLEKAILQMPAGGLASGTLTMYALKKTMPRKTLF